MTPAEWWLVFDVRRADKDKVDKRLSKRRADEIVKWAEEKDRQDQLKEIALHGIRR